MDSKLANVLIENSMSSIDVCSHNIRLMNEELQKSYFDYNATPIHTLNRMQTEIDIMSKQIAIVVRCKNGKNNI